MDLSVDDAPFQIEFAFSSLHMLEEVTHEEDMDLGLILHMHREDTVDSGNETIFILDQVGEVAGKSFEHHLLFTPVHRLNDEALVIGLEHKAA